MTDRRSAYWDRKIRKWAKSSYGAEREGILSKMRTSICARKEETKKLLRQYASPGFTLVDLGCGAGQLALEAVQELQASSAMGRDFSAEAIHVAQELRAKADIPADTLHYEVADIDVPIPPADIVTALGLVDWLQEGQIRALIQNLRGRRFVISYSEQDGSFDEIVHRVWLVWRLKLRPGVRAYHHRRDFIFGLFKEAGIEGVQQVSSKGMRFGRLVHNLAED